MQKQLEYKLFKEEITLSPVSKRALAFAIDKLLLSFIVFAAMSDKFVGKDIEGVIEALNHTFLFTTILEISYQTVFVAMYGATLGKILLKIRVIDVNTLDRPAWAPALLRASMRFLGETLFYLGLVWAFFDPFKQGWHDKLAKTVVIDVPH